MFEKLLLIPFAQRGCKCIHTLLMCSFRAPIQNEALEPWSVRSKSHGTAWHGSNLRHVQLSILYADMANALEFKGTVDSHAEIRPAALGINWESLCIRSLRGSHRLGVGVGLQALSHDGLFGGQIQMVKMTYPSGRRRNAG